VDAAEVRRLVDQYNATYPAPANVALKDVPRANRDAQGRAYPYIILPDNFSNNDSFMSHDLLKLVALTPDQKETDGYDVNLRNEHWLNLGLVENLAVIPPLFAGAAVTAPPAQKTEPKP
jgi:hypothetical protein